MSPRRVSATATAYAALLFATLLLCFSPVLARIEVKGSKDYQNVKEDFLCRACVGVGEVFFEEVLSPIADRYRTAPFTSASAASRGSSSGSASGRPASKASHRQREQMIVEVHEAIDGLCDALEKSIQRQSLEAVNIAVEDVAARQLLSPLMSSKDLRDGVMTACPMALEEISDALTDTAFRHLLPHEKRRAPEEESKEASASRAENETAVYELPAAGTFCEDVGLCSRFVHYHITSDAAVRRRAREAQAAEDAAAQKAEGDHNTEESLRASTAAAASAKTQDKKKTSKKSTPTTRKSAKKHTAQYGTDTTEDESFWQTARRVFQLSTWQELRESLNSTEVLSARYWVRGLSMVLNPEVRFHLQAYVPLAVTYSLCLAAVLVLVLALVLVCRRKPDKVSAHKREQSGVETMSKPVLAKKEQ